MQTTTRTTTPATTPSSARPPLRTRLARALTTPRAARITFPFVFVLLWALIVPLLPSRILPTPLEVAEEMWTDADRRHRRGGVLDQPLPPAARLHPRPRDRWGARPRDGGLPAHQRDAARLRRRGAHVPVPDLGIAGGDVVRLRAVRTDHRGDHRRAAVRDAQHLRGCPRRLEGSARHGLRVRGAAAARDSQPRVALAQPVLLRLAAVRPRQRLEGARARRGVRSGVGRGLCDQRVPRLRQLRWHHLDGALLRGLLDHRRAPRVRPALHAGVPLASDDRRRGHRASGR